MVTGNYSDIEKRISEEPKWWDENGCPRYEDFRPELAPNIYAHEAVLLLIACQECGRNFLVAMSRGVFDFETWESRIKKWLEQKQRGDKNAWTPIHYGDPPYHSGENCVAGYTMNCWDLRIIQFWSKSKSIFEWRRIKELEVELERPVNDATT